jgi:hypothetical protein
MTERSALFAEFTELTFKLTYEVVPWMNPS